MMLVYTKPTHNDVQIEEVVVKLQGFLLDSTLPPMRQQQYVVLVYRSTYPDLKLVSPAFLGTKTASST